MFWSIDLHSFADPDPGSQNVADPSDPKHCRLKVVDNIPMPGANKVEMSGYKNVQSNANLLCVKTKSIESGIMHQQCLKSKLINRNLFVYIQKLTKVNI